jgi:hypothetical protein
VEKWRLEHPHDTPPYPFMPSPTFADSSDNIGTLQHKIYVNNLKLLRAQIIESLQRLLSDFPNWEIMVAISVPGIGDSWPDMGLTIRAHEIVDGLQRQYFPTEFRSLAYQGAKHGTDRD